MELELKIKAYIVEFLDLGWSSSGSKKCREISILDLLLLLSLCSMRNAKMVPSFCMVQLFAMKKITRLFGHQSKNKTEHAVQSYAAGKTTLEVMLRMKILSNKSVIAEYQKC